MNQRRILLAAIFVLIALANGAELDGDFGFFYNSNSGTIILYKKDSDLTLKAGDLGDPTTFLNHQNVIKEETILTEENKSLDYVSKAQNGLFNIAYYSVFLNNNLFNFIHISYSANELNFREVIIQDPNDERDLITYPSSYQNKITVEKCPRCSVSRSKREKKSLSDVFGLKISNADNGGFSVDKIYLVSYNKEKVVYFADMTSLIEDKEPESEEKELDFYLENMPERFDLHMTLSMKETKEKVLVVKRRLKNPEYGAEKGNPNYNLLIVSGSILGVAFGITFIIVIIHHLV